MLTFEHWLRELHEKIVVEFNLQLADAIPRWRDHLKLVSRERSLTRKSPRI